MSGERVVSGIPGLELVLGGGLPASSVSLISGPPGAGKTVLAQQIVYTGASEERPAIYFTTVTESLEKVISHVQPFEFFRRGLLGHALQYIPLGETLIDSGLTGAMEVIRNEVTRVFPSYVVIDSFRALRDFSSKRYELSRFLYGLANTLGSLRCSTLLLDEGPVEEVMESAGAAVADVVIYMGNVVSGRSNRRSMRVLKLRGSDYLPGSHFFEITRAGIRVYPRLGSLLPDTAFKVENGFCPSGVEDLDGFLGGGLARGGVCLVTGGLGTGKTIFSLGFVTWGAARGEPGVFLSLQEGPGRLRQAAQDFNWDIDALEKKGLLRMLHVPPLDLEVDRLGHLLLENIRETGARRVVIDAITDLDTAAIGEDDYQSFLYAIGQILQSLGVTVVFTVATEDDDGSLGAVRPIGRLADAMMRLDLKLLPDGVSRVMHLVKTRAGPNGAALLPLAIRTGQGLTIIPRVRAELPETVGT